MGNPGAVSIQHEQSRRLASPRKSALKSGCKKRSTGTGSKRFRRLIARFLALDYLTGALKVGGSDCCTPGFGMNDRRSIAKENQISSMEPMQVSIKINMARIHYTR